MRRGGSSSKEALLDTDLDSPTARVDRQKGTGRTRTIKPWRHDSGCPIQYRWGSGDKSPNFLISSLFSE